MLTSLETKARHECSEALRGVLLVKNGLAGVHLLRGDLRRGDYRRPFFFFFYHFLFLHSH